MDYIMYGIAYACPHGKRNNDCPLYEIDHPSYKEKYNWIKGLKEDKKLLIIRCHMACSERRVKAAMEEIDKINLPQIVP